MDRLLESASFFSQVMHVPDTVGGLRFVTIVILISCFVITIEAIWLLHSMSRTSPFGILGRLAFAITGTASWGFFWGTLTGELRDPAPISAILQLGMAIGLLVVIGGRGRA